MDCSLPGSSVPGISQTRILEWVALSFFRGSFWPRGGAHVSCFGRQILYHWATWIAPWQRACVESSWSSSNSSIQFLEIKAGWLVLYHIPSPLFRYIYFLWLNFMVLKCIREVEEYNCRTSCTKEMMNLENDSQRCRAERKRLVLQHPGKSSSSVGDESSFCRKDCKKAKLSLKYSW